MSMMGSLTLLLLLCVAWRTSGQLSSEWRLFEDFVLSHEKPYRNNSLESLTRFSTFKESLERQRELNLYEKASGGRAVYGVNKFSDLTQDEFKRLYLSKILPGSTSKHSFQHTTLDTAPPNEFDWRDKKVVTPVKDQYQCGGCWAFSTIETLESRWAIQGKPLLQLSVQQLISCSYLVEPDLAGCRGGALYAAAHFLQYYSEVIVLASHYPFASKNGQEEPCKANLPDSGIILLNYTYWTSVGNETAMQQALYTYSPLTVSVNAAMWQDYIGGIIQHHCSSSPSDLNHAVQLVGYDISGPVPYWAVRNSWGTDWGVDGYAKLMFGANTCGVADEVVVITNTEGINL